jgi:hypothetical protein
MTNHGQTPMLETIEDLTHVTGGGLFANMVGRMGLTIDPKTGQRVRTRAVQCDDWGNTVRVVEQWNPNSGSWRRTGTVPGSISGGHY